MSSGIASIMVPVDGDHPADGQLTRAGALAIALHAEIVGISACEHSPSFYVLAGAVANDLLMQEEQRMKDRMTAAGERVRKVLAPQGVTFDWRSAIGIPVDFVAREARAADLLLCFLRKEPAPFSGIDAGELVLRAGRPLLAVPEDRELREPTRVLVAWQDTREARRAVRDALPFLQRAQEVLVIEVVEDEESPKRVAGRLADVARWLNVHGVKAAQQAISPRNSVAEEIHSAAGDLDADLIVMGAYGHSRLGEWIFGGVTRDLMIEPHRQVFASH
jgi:nucleotide-binding universal stress UspA family protein